MQYQLHKHLPNCNYKPYQLCYFTEDLKMVTFVDITDKGTLLQIWEEPQIDLGE